MARTGAATPGVYARLRSYRVSQGLVSAVAVLPATGEAC